MILTVTLAAVLGKLLVVDINPIVFVDAIYGTINAGKPPHTPVYETP